MKGDLARRRRNRDGNEDRRKAVLGDQKRERSGPQRAPFRSTSRGREERSMVAASLLSMGVGKVFLFISLVAVSGSIGVSAFDFDVGGEHGWVVPPSNNTRFYNQWASKNRFKVGDSLIFKYKKDSVMMVIEEEYDHCSSKQPIFFYNNGNTEIQLDHAGTYYFISGLREHCEKGLKMIVKVLSHPEGPGSSPSGNQTGTTPPTDISGAFQTSMASPLELLVLLAGSVFLF